MFEDIFVTKNNKLSTLIKLGDALGRAIRENTILFSVDSDIDRVSYLTESGKIVTGVVDYDHTYPVLEHIAVQESSLLMDEKKYNEYLDFHISNLLANLHEDQEREADTSLSYILNLWQNRLLLSKKEQQLKEKTSMVQEFTNILGTDTFQRVDEIKDNIIEFLKENKEKVLNIVELKNAIQLSKQVSAAFDIPKINYESLKESSFSYDEPTTGSVYNLICRQELLKKELLESRKNFANVWYTNDTIRELAGNIYGVEEDVEASLAKAIVEVPYLALVSKRDIRETLTFALDSAKTSISAQDIQKYSSKLFELKKPVKEEVIRILNEKYGINILTLKETPSFKSLLNTQVVIFECLSKISPKNSVQKTVLSEVSDMLKGKNGVESLEVSDFLNHIFTESGCTELIQEGQLESYLDFSRIADDMESISGVLRMIKAKMGGGMDPGMGQPPMGTPPMGQPPSAQPPQEQEPGMGLNQEDPAKQPNPALAPDPATDGDFEAGGFQPGGMGAEDDDVATPAMDADQVPIDSDEDLLAQDDEMAAEGPPPMEQGSDELMANISDLEALLQDLKTELGVEDDSVEANMPMEDEFPPEEGMEGEEEEFPPEEGMEGEEEEFPPEEGTEEEEGEEEEFSPEEEEEEEEGPPIKKKKGKKKIRLDGPDKEFPTEKVK